jgi:hypothetical protein
MHSASNFLNISSNLTDLQKLVFAGLISLAVAVAGIAIKYWLDKRAFKKSAKLDFSKAAAEFQAAFTEEIILLEKPATTSHESKVYHILMNAAAKHKTAMIKFRPHVAQASRSSFDKAWEEYQDIKKYTSGAQEIEKTKRQLALDRIKKIFEFAV